MKAYTEMSKEELIALKEELEKKYQFSRLRAQRANDEFWLATLDDLEKRMK